MLSLPLVLVFMALGLTVASAYGKPPLWCAVFVLCVASLIQLWR